MNQEQLAAASKVFERHYPSEEASAPAAAPEETAPVIPVEQASAVEPAEQTPVAPTPDEQTPPASDVDLAEDLGASFKLSDVPEEYREHVERYVRMTHGAFTRKSQTVAEQRRAAEKALELQARLDDPGTRDEALKELLSQSGWSVMDDEPPAAPATAENDGPEAEPSSQATADPELAARLAAIEQRQAAQDAKEAAEQREDYLDAVQDVINEGLGDLAQELGTSAESLPAHVKDLVLGFARQLPPIEGQWPDMKGAAARYHELRAAEIQAYVATKRAPEVNAEGSAGTQKFDPKNRKERLAAMEAIAGRHS